MEICMMMQPRGEGSRDRHDLKEGWHDGYVERYTVKYNYVFLEKKKTITMSTSSKSKNNFPFFLCAVNKAGR